MSAKDPTTGADRYMYARADPASGRLLSTHLEVGTADPESIGLTKHELPSQAFRGLNSTTLTNFNALMRRRRDSSRERRQLSGTVRNLVVMVRFADHVNRTLPSKSDLNTLFNNVGPHALCPTGSVRDVWFQNSYGKLAIESVLTDWITVNQTELYSSGGARGMTTVIHQALSAALAQAYNIVDFSLFDANKDGYIDMVCCCVGTARVLRLLRFFTLPCPLARLKICPTCGSSTGTHTDHVHSLWIRCGVGRQRCIRHKLP